MATSMRGLTQVSRKRPGARLVLTIWLVHCGHPRGKSQGARGEKDQQGDGQHPKEV